MKANDITEIDYILCSAGFTNANCLAKKLLLLQDLCLNLGGVENVFGTTATIGSDASRGGWSLQTLKHIIIQSGSLLDKLTSEKITAKYESKLYHTVCIIQYVLTK